MILVIFIHVKILLWIQKILGLLRILMKDILLKIGKTFLLLLLHLKSGTGDSSQEIFILFYLNSEVFTFILYLHSDPKSIILFWKFSLFRIPKSKLCLITNPQSKSCSQYPEIILSKISFSWLHLPLLTRFHIILQVLWWNENNLEWNRWRKFLGNRGFPIQFGHLWKEYQNIYEKSNRLRIKYCWSTEGH